MTEKERLERELVARFDRRNVWLTISGWVIAMIATLLIEVVRYYVPQLHGLAAWLTRAIVLIACLGVWHTRGMIRTDIGVDIAHMTAEACFQTGDRFLLASVEKKEHELTALPPGNERDAQLRIFKARAEAARRVRSA